MERNGSGGGGCCIARYTHAPYYYSKMDRIMLRYRPIAPKPVSGSGPTAGSTPLNDDVKPAGGKAKRRNSGGNNNKRRKWSRTPDEIKSEGEQKCHVERERVTLPLLPESPDLVSPRSNQSRPIIHNQKLSSSSTMPMWLSFGGDNHEVVVGTTSVMVEGVTDTWLDGTGLGRTDEERRSRLDEDTCPGFISDGWNRVWWTNEAFSRMATGGTAVAVAVRLGMREKVELPKVKLFPAFTCRVRVQYGKDGSHTMTVPCDVWRMDGGGFAWRLDVKAALSLGR